MKNAEKSLAKTVSTYSKSFIDFSTKKILKKTFFYHCSNARTITESRLNEDPFVTADDNTNTTNSTTSSLKKQDSIDSQSINEVIVKKRNSKSLPVKNDGTLDYDGKLKIHFIEIFPF